MSFRVSPSIRSIPVFPSQTNEQLLRKYNLEGLIQMAANENCYGPSTKALEAIRTAPDDLHRYPNAYAAQLKIRIAESCRVEPSQIVIGNGSTELIQMIAKTFVQPGENCITARQTFPIYEMAVSAVNAICRTVPLRDDRFDPDALLSAIDDETRVLWIANPNNPTGTTIAEEDLLRFLKRVPSNILVVLDEAYREYADAPDRVSYIAGHENLILLRTFSKIHGLAALRIGYAIASPVVAEDLSRVAAPYSVNGIGQMAAMAALDDFNHCAVSVRKNAEQRQLVQQEFAQRRYKFIPSETNFVLLLVPEPVQLLEGLLREGILVAHVSHFHMPDGIRITLGLPDENEKLLRILRNLL